MVHSSFEYAPGLLIYRSERPGALGNSLVNALHRYVGSVYAPDIVKHNGRWYIYFPVVTPAHTTNMVVWADSGRAVERTGRLADRRDRSGTRGRCGGKPLPADEQRLPGSAGRRRAFGDRAPHEKVYDGWEFPKEWDVEGFCLEGPKIRKNRKILLYADGRGRNGRAADQPHGRRRAGRAPDRPVENSPYNPLVHTYSPDERWCSKGHGTLIDTPDGQWYVVYHAYERGFYYVG